jgi:hypothetical protein
MTKKKPRYESRVFDGRIIHSAEIERIHKEVLDFERIGGGRDSPRTARRSRHRVHARVVPEASTVAARSLSAICLSMRDPLSPALLAGLLFGHPPPP